MWCHNLRKRRPERALHKVLKVLQVAYLACDLQALAIRGPPVVEHAHRLIAVLDGVVKNEVGADG